MVMLFEMDFLFRFPRSVERTGYRERRAVGGGVTEGGGSIRSDLPEVGANSRSALNRLTAS